jgi:hypothetical protein
MSILTYPDGLKMFTAHEEWCIASSPEDASKCYEEAIGESLEAQAGDEKIEWTEEPPDKIYRYNDDGNVIEKTCAEWVREKGRGYFASANI